jgi:hypothetical protein
MCLPSGQGALACLPSSVQAISLPSSVQAIHLPSSVQAISLLSSVQAISLPLSVQANVQANVPALKSHQAKVHWTGCSQVFRQ